MLCVAALAAGCSGRRRHGHLRGSEQRRRLGERRCDAQTPQWWEPELPDGEFRALMDDFEAQNPGIKVKLLSGPYASTKEQVIASAAAGEMSDVVGLDGAWVLAALFSRDRSPISAHS